MVLRQNLVPLSYTSLPVLSTASTRQTLNLAHVANGTYAGGSFKTSFLIFNISTSPANVTLALTQDNGTPLNVTIPARDGRHIQLPVPWSRRVALPPDRRIRRPVRRRSHHSLQRPDRRILHFHRLQLAG